MEGLGKSVVTIGPSYFTINISWPPIPFLNLLLLVAFNLTWPWTLSHSPPLHLQLIPLKALSLWDSPLTMIHILFTPSTSIHLTLSLSSFLWINMLFWPACTLYLAFAYFHLGVWVSRRNWHPFSSSRLPHIENTQFENECLDCSCLGRSILFAEFCP